MTDERPLNVIAFYEEFRESVRWQTFPLPERFPPSEVFDEVRTFQLAKQILQSMKVFAPHIRSYLIELLPKLPLNLKGEDLIGEEMYGEVGKSNEEEQRLC